MVKEEIREIGDTHILVNPLGFVEIVRNLIDSPPNGNIQGLRKNLLENYKEISQKYLDSPTGFDQGFQHTAYSHGKGMRIELTWHQYGTPHDLSFIFDINRKKELSSLKILDTHRSGSDTKTDTFKINLLKGNGIEVKKIDLEK